MSEADGVFMAGEVVTGPGSAIQAAANGHRAAKAVDLYFEGKDVAAGLKAATINKINVLPPDVAAKVRRASRETIEVLDPATRCREFTQIEIGYNELSALKEARRCRSCGGGAVVNQEKCMACLTCLRVCPYDAPEVTNASYISPDRCQACGLCAPECPGRAISMFGYDVDEIKRTMPETLGSVDTGRADPAVVAFMCARFALDRSVELPPNIKPVQVHCASRVDTLDMLKAFECGADGVAVVLCDGESCRHPGVTARVIKRVEHVRAIGAPVGLGGESIGYVAAPEGGDWKGALDEFVSGVPLRGK
jgi:coenzyme F420-reducing hydrogenase delta subunit/Pyruvate/2-oxoacid:ferredoxin oxidoreductase delta subunit